MTVKLLRTMSETVILFVDGQTAVRQRDRIRLKIEQLNYALVLSEIEDMVQCSLRLSLISARTKLSSFEMELEQTSIRLLR